MMICHFSRIVHIIISISGAGAAGPGANAWRPAAPRWRGGAAHRRRRADRGARARRRSAELAQTMREGLGDGLVGRGMAEQGVRGGDRVDLG